MPDEPTGSPTLKDLKDRVLHLQAPDCRTTSVKWGSLHKGKWREDGLGVELPVLHLQLKDLHQTTFIDVAVVDDQGEMHLVRASTWQVSYFVPAQVSLLPKPFHTDSIGIDLPLPVDGSQAASGDARHADATASSAAIPVILVHIHHSPPNSLDDHLAPARPSPLRILRTSTRV